MARHRFCSFYFAAGRLWKTLDFSGESVILTTGRQRRFEDADGSDGLWIIVFQ
jgi:hypothetical protein